MNYKIRFDQDKHLAPPGPILQIVIDYPIVVATDYWRQ